MVMHCVNSSTLLESNKKQKGHSDRVLEVIAKSEVGQLLNIT